MNKDNIIENIRTFNRFYVDLLGLLKAGGYHSSYTLAETRVLFEIGEGDGIQASQIMLRIQIDKSYLSRILKRLEKNDLVRCQRSKNDARAIVLSLTPNGKAEIEKINLAASVLVSTQISALDDSTCQVLVKHMKAIEHIFQTKTIYDHN